jgi:hypothetical protein
VGDENITKEANMTPEQFLQSKGIYSEAKVGADRKPSEPYKFYKIADLIREYIKLTKL